MNSGWSLTLERMRRGMWVALAVGMLAAAVGAWAHMAQPSTYTSRAALTIGSPNRAPDQDGVLATGYVDFFNDPGFQSDLKSSARIAGDVALHASTAAASPIIYIEATSRSREEAVSSAATAADDFRAQINGPLRASQDETIAALRKPFDDARLANGVVTEVSLDQLQDQVNQIRGDTANQLISLQKNVALGESSDGSWAAVLFAFLGGLAVGLIGVITWAAVSRRVSTSAELAAKTGLSPIVEIPAASAKTVGRLRDQRFQQLVNAVALAGPTCETIAVTSTVTSVCNAQVARELARGRAAQGARTILVNADLNVRDGIGFGDVITDDSVALHSVVLPTGLSNLWEVKSGSISQEPFAAITYSRTSSLLARLGTRADCVIISAPPVTQAAEAQILCAAVDGVLLVIDGERSRVSDTNESVQLLAASNATMIGSVLIEESATAIRGIPREVESANGVVENTTAVRDDAEAAAIGGS